jgi:hypothetical protein
MVRSPNDGHPSCSVSRSGRRVDEAFAELKVTEQKARDAADKARKARSPTSWRLLRWRSGAGQPVPEPRWKPATVTNARLTLFGARRFW